MKKLLSFIFAMAFLLGLAGCANKEMKVWDWAQSLTQADIISVTPWCHDTERKELEPLNEAQILELVSLLNNLTKGSFTENKDLVGITPTVGITVKTASETYHINYAPSPYGKYGMLEIGYNEKLWWIDNTALLDFFESITHRT